MCGVVCAHIGGYIPVSCLLEEIRYGIYHFKTVLNKIISEAENNFVAVQYQKL